MLPVRQFVLIALWALLAPAQGEEEAAAGFGRANALVQAHNFAAALSEYNALLAKYPGVAVGYNNRAVARHGLGDLDGAMTDVGQAINLDPKKAEFYRTRAWLWREQARFSEAVNDLDKALELEPQDAPTTHLRGLVKMEMSNFSGAEADFSHTLELAPDFPNAHDNRAAARLYQGNLDQALLDANHAIELNAKSTSAHLHRGLIKQAGGTPEAALADFGRALALDPKNFTALFARGLAYGSMGRTAEAIADFDHALVLKPDSADAVCARARVRRDNGDLEGARNDYSRALVLRPTFTAAFLGRGSVYYLRQRWTEAYADFAAAGRQQPLQPFAWLYAWVARARQGETPNATREMRGHLLTHPLGPEASWFLAVTAYTLGELDDEGLQAAAQSGDAVSARERACQAAYFAGLRQLTAGRKQEAIECFRKAREAETSDFFEYGFAAAELKALGEAQ